MKKIEKFIYILIIIMVLLFIILGIKDSEASSRDVIREARIEACKQASIEYKDWIEERYIHTSQDWILRCVTYSTLIYAKETGFGTSRMCVVDNNCHGLRPPTYDIRIPYRISRSNFMIFKTPDESNLAFARLYARFHMNKTADELIKGVWRNGKRVGAYSQTDQNTYVRFIKDNYWDTYNELKFVKNK